MTIAIKGIEKMLTPQEIAILINRPARFVLRNLIKSGALKAKKITSREYRVRPCDLERWMETR